MDLVTPEEVGFSVARLGRIGETVQRFVDEGKVGGAVTLVARRGQVAHFEAFGLQDREARRSMQREAIFRIASMTKPITCTAALMLLEEGRFLLDDPVAEYLPEFGQSKVYVRETENGVEVAELERPITIRHLFTHSSGITYDFWPNDPVSQIYAREKIGAQDRVLSEKSRQIAALPLAHQPGARLTYGMSHDILGRLVEVVSGQPFGSFLRQRIFDPLEMSDTDFSVAVPKLDRLARVYSSQEQRELSLSETRDLSQPPAWPSGGGGLVSTASDYLRFAQTLLNGGSLGKVRLLSRKTVDLLTANQWPSGQDPFPADWLNLAILGGYGYGLGVRTMVNPAQSGVPGSVGEFGWSGAFSTYFWVDPREQLIGLFLLQLVPFNLRPAYLFHVLAYQALAD